jgi:exoribonuclease R
MIHKSQTIEDTGIEREDFRDTLTVAIDPATAKDFDDAISFKSLNNGN